MWLWVNTVFCCWILLCKVQKRPGFLEVTDKKGRMNMPVSKYMCDYKLGQGTEGEKPGAARLEGRQGR